MLPPTSNLGATKRRKPTGAMLVALLFRPCMDKEHVAPTYLSDVDTLVF